MSNEEQDENVVAGTFTVYSLPLSSSVHVAFVFVFFIWKTLLIAYLTPTPNCHILFSNKNYCTLDATASEALFTSHHCTMHVKTKRRNKYFPCVFAVRWRTTHTASLLAVPVFAMDHLYSHLNFCCILRRRDGCIIGFNVLAVFPSVLSFFYLILNCWWQELYHCAFACSLPSQAIVHFNRCAQTKIGEYCTIAWNCSRRFRGGGWDFPA